MRAASVDLSQKCGSSEKHESLGVWTTRVFIACNIVASGVVCRTDVGHWWPRPNFPYCMRGILALGVAVCAFVWPQQTLGFLIKLLGIYFLMDGVIVAIWTYRSGDTTSPLMQAAVSLAIGLGLLLWTDVSQLRLLRSGFSRYSWLFSD